MSLKKALLIKACIDEDTEHKLNIINAYIPCIYILSALYF